MKLESELKHNGVRSTRGQHKKFEDSPRTNARGRVRGQGQIFEDEAEDKLWPRGQLGLEDLTSLVLINKTKLLCILYFTREFVHC